MTGWRRHPRRHPIASACYLRFFDTLIADVRDTADAADTADAVVLPKFLTTAL